MLPSPPGRVVALPGQESSSPAGPGQAGNPVAVESAALTAPLRGLYLHGEAWGSESLPVGATVKLGIPRIYLVLGAAVGPADHRSGWAFGGGLGTVGKARGRFTLSLDLMQWFLTGDGEMDASQGRLTQLRPALAWQLKRGSRWQLIGGPTLNLASARRDGMRTRWTLGQDQWLWLDSADGPANTRLWPGVQLGVRF
ncbi:MAG: hypothetical protein ACRYFZ_05335 [Janthinobacterium lividum]